MKLYDSTHPLRPVEPVRVLPPFARAKLQMRAAPLARPLRRGVDKLCADATAAMARRDDEVLQPAARPVADRQDVRVHRGEPHNAVAVEGKQNIGIAVMDGVLEPGAPAFRRVARRRNARRLEQLLDESEHRRFVFWSGGSDADS